MKKLTKDDLLVWARSAEDINSTKKSTNVSKKFPKPNELPKGKIRKLAKKNIILDAEIDLHGLNRFEARDEIEKFIIQSINMGYRYINVITGKGSGVIKKTIIDFLHEESTFRYIIGYSNAHRKMGGEGAIVLHLRKKETIG